MKKHIVCFLLMLVLSNFSFAQILSGEVTYKVKVAGNFNKYLTDKGFSSNQKSMMNHWFKQIKSGLPYLSFQLRFNQQEAVYQGDKFMSNDNGIDLNSTKRFVGGSGIFYTNVEKNLRLHQINYLHKDWLIDLKISDLDWKITEETKKIQGYTCIKAIAEFGSIFVRKGKVIAWFCPKLPFQFGPMSYAGLPGLILGLQHDFYYFYADKITLSTKTRNIQKPTKGKRVTQAEYFKEAGAIEKQMKEAYK